MFGQRLLSSVVLMIFTITLLVTGGNLLFAALVLISFIGMTELYKVIKIEKTLPAFCGYAAAFCYDYLVYQQREQDIMWVAISFLMILMTVYVLSFPKYKAGEIMLVFFGLFYVTVMLLYIYRVRMLPDGLLLVWLIFIGSWGSDTCAYCTGILIGRHKLAPVLSPKKSIEGSIGGIAGASAIGLLYAAVFHNYITEFDNPYLAFAVIGGVSSIISQVGDLAASGIKRDHKVKDYGNLIPGHGGILDRFDSVIFTAPVVYFLTQIFI